MASHTSISKHFPVIWDHLIITILFILIFSDFINSKVATNNEIYYKAPSFNIKNANITFGAITFSGKVEDISLDDLSTSFMSICQAIFINSKNNPITMNGTINLVIQEFDERISSGQNSALTVLSNNLYYTANGTKVNSQTNIDLAGLYSSLNFGTAKINSLASNDFGLPFVSSGDLGRESPDNQFSGSIEATRVTFAQIKTTSRFDTFDAALQVLKHFNWTLVANMYEANTYGYDCQKKVLNYAAEYDSPKFSCNIIFKTVNFIQKSEYSEAVSLFCKCVTEKSSINVIILWMSTSSAVSAISILKKYCQPAAEKWTYFITNDFQSLGYYYSDLDQLVKKSFLLRINPPVSIKGFISKCQQLAPPEVKEKLRSLLSLFYKIFYKCQLYPDSENDNFVKCASSIDERNGDCICGFDETDMDPYVVS